MSTSKTVKLSRAEQLAWVTTWAWFKHAGLSDRVILESMAKDYEEVYGECNQLQFCNIALQQLRSYSGGGGLDEALRQSFDPDIALTITAVKSSADVDAAIHKLVHQLTSWEKIKQGVFGSLAGSVALVSFGVSAFVGLTFLAQFVVNMLKGAGQNMPQHISDNFLISANVFVSQHWLPIVVCIGLVCLLWFYTLTQYVGSYRPIFDRYAPGFSFYAANESARFYAILSVLVTSGNLSLKTALERLRDSGLCSIYLESHIEEMLYRLQHQQKSGGDNGGAVDKIDTGLLPSSLRMKLRAMERQPNSEEKMGILALIGEELITVQGAGLLKKVRRNGMFIQYSVLLSVVITAALFLDLVFSLRPTN